jgi:hypothetical protein
MLLPQTAVFASLAGPAADELPFGRIHRLLH